MRHLVLGAIRVYQLTVSPYIPRACRHVPSCSQYMAESITKYGVWKGSIIGTRRLLRCQPLGKGGYDPVP